MVIPFTTALSISFFSPTIQVDLVPPKEERTSSGTSYFWASSTDLICSTLAPAAGKFEHFLVSYFIQVPRSWTDVRSAVDPVHVV